MRETEACVEAVAPSDILGVQLERHQKSGSQTGGVNVTGGIELAADVVGRDKIINVFETPAVARRVGSAPPVPALFIGRDEGLNDLKQRLGIGSGVQEAGAMQVLTSVRGWPGMGKTTIAAALAHDTDVEKAFPDGILWTSLGERPALLSVIITWGRALGNHNLLQATGLKEASMQLAAMLQKKRALLIVDDVWETEHVEPIRQARGRDCALLLTTREPKVANHIGTPDTIYTLPPLTPENALKLLAALAPAVFQGRPEECRELVGALECLPLAIHVAGHLLNVEAHRGWGVDQLLTDLQSGKQLLEQKAPPDRMDFERQSIPTVAALLQKSTDRLSPETRNCFAYLGAFAAKPASFDISALRSVWQINDPKPAVDELVDRGLLEPVGSGRFQMHVLLVALARSLAMP